MFKAIHGLAPHYLCNDVTMIVDVHGYNTRRSENIQIQIQNSFIASHQT